MIRLSILTRAEVSRQEVVTGLHTLLGDDPSGVARMRCVKRGRNPDGTLIDTRAIVIIDAADGYTLPTLDRDSVLIDAQKLADLDAAELTKLVPWSLTSSLRERGAVLDDLAKQLQPLHRGVDYTRGLSPGGTFTDDFSGESSEVDLQDHTPSGGTAWTRTGTANMLVCGSAGYVHANSESGSGIYICDDQGSADHYTEARLKKLAANPLLYVCVRLVDVDNWIGWKNHGTGATGLQLCDEVAGVLDNTHLKIQGVDESVYRIEMSGTGWAFFEDAAPQGTGTITDHSTETSQGLVNHAREQSQWIDDFEAGALAGGGGLPPGQIRHTGALGAQQINGGQIG